MTTTADDIFATWENDGDDMRAASALAMELGEVESALEPLKEEREHIRALLSHIVAKRGEKVTIAGFGVLEVTAPSVVRSYEKAALDQLIIQLLEEGDIDIVQRIVACRRESARAGGLRVTMEKST